MVDRYDLIAFDIDGTFGPSGRELTKEQLSLVDTTAPEEFKAIDKKGFNYVAFPGVVYTIRRLQQIQNLRVAVISNGFSYRQRNKLTLCGLEGLFDPVYISEEYARGLFDSRYNESLHRSIQKPNPVMLKKIGFETTTKSHRCVYVGNTDGDLQAAQRAGWDFIGVIDKDEKYKDDFKEEQNLKLVQQHEFEKILGYILE